MEVWRPGWAIMLLSHPAMDDFFRCRMGMIPVGSPGGEWSRSEGPSCLLADALVPLE